jgi:hypothetical protein
MRGYVAEAGYERIEETRDIADPGTVGSSKGSAGWDGEEDEAG